MSIGSHSHHPGSKNGSFSFKVPEKKELSNHNLFGSRIPSIIFPNLGFESIIASGLSNRLVREMSIPSKNNIETSGSLPSVHVWSLRNVINDPSLVQNRILSAASTTRTFHLGKVRSGHLEFWSSNAYSPGECGGVDPNLRNLIEKLTS